MFFLFFFFEKIHKIPICKVSLKKLFFQNLSKNDLQNPDIYDFAFLFSKNVISRYYRNYQHFFSNWHYAWGKTKFFWYFFIHFHNGWQVEISLFPTIFTIVQSDTPPPIVLLRKRQKVSKFYLLFFRQKLENRSLHAENDFFKIFEKNVPMGILTKISKNLPVV